MVYDQKKRKDRQTMPWSKEKKRQTNNTTMVLFVCLFFSFLLTMVLFVCLYFSFDHGIVCLSFLLTMVLFVCLYFSFDYGIVRKDRQAIPWSKEKKRKDRQTMPWSKEKKRKVRQTIPWSKE
jgi:Ca2+/Na+ antiporter